MDNAKALVAEANGCCTKNYMMNMILNVTPAA